LKKQKGQPHPFSSWRDKKKKKKKKTIINDKLLIIRHHAPHQEKEDTMALLKMTKKQVQPPSGISRIAQMR
jgi:hypothetical protein